MKWRIPTLIVMVIKSGMCFWTIPSISTWIRLVARSVVIGSSVVFPTTNTPSSTRMICTNRMTTSFPAPTTSHVDIMVGTTLSYEFTNSIQLHELYKSSSSSHGRIIPTYHPYSRFHYQYLYQARYASKMSYAEYCVFEEAVANILLAWIHDTRPITYHVYWTDASWYHEESVLSYMTSDERKKLFRILVRSLDEVGDIEPAPYTTMYPEQTWFEWKTPTHPFL